jgi:hypothetical protein
MSTVDTKKIKRPYENLPRVINDIIASYIAPSKDQIKLYFKEVMWERIALIPCYHCDGFNANWFFRDELIDPKVICSPCYNEWHTGYYTEDEELELVRAVIERK